jgi:hypothetical protein
MLAEISGLIIRDTLMQRNVFGLVGCDRFARSGATAAKPDVPGFGSAGQKVAFLQRAASRKLRS